tara:strand:- start:128 stop:472 length:345 start_codon:yes stop_codon:yes gene_type:complete
VAIFLNGFGVIKLDLDKINYCPNCNNKIDEKLKLKLLKSADIRCPHCAKDLRISESKTYLVTLPLFLLFGYCLSKFTSLSDTMALTAIVIFVFASYYPSRTIEILLTRLKLVNS